MTYRPSPKYASKDARQGAWASCDRCGFLNNLPRLHWNYDFKGGSVPQRTGFLFCDRCQDELNYQQKLLIIPPDPPPLFNTRPEAYAVDETDWLTTQDGDIITTESAEPLLPTIPNPADVAYTSVLLATLNYPSGSLTSLYLDLFNGSPTAGGVSILATITGSATRTNIGSSLSTTTTNHAVNTDVLTVTSSVVTGANVTHIAFYNAATAGTLLVSGALSATYPTLVSGAVVQFDALGLSFNLN